MDGQAGTEGRLQPLEYHWQVADLLQRLEPEIWDGFVAAASQPGSDHVHARLLRSAYRLEPAGHPELAAAVERARAGLGVQLPVSVYQLEGDAGANASLLYLPGEAVLTLSGNLLGLLDPDELTAVIGHELAHAVLWGAHGGRLLVADQVLHALSLDAGTPAAYLETARRWQLATKLVADRGGVLACGNLAVGVRALVKTVTGLASVDAAAYLRQAEAADPLRGAQGGSHPETVLRAWALARWSAPEGDGDQAAAALLCPRLDLDALDLADQQRLTTLTRDLVAALLADHRLRTEAMLATARLYFPDYLDDLPDDLPDELPAPGPRVPAEATDETRRYLAYLLLDFATADGDLDDRALLAALRLAHRAGLGDALAEAVRREQVVPARTLTALLAQADPAGAPV